MKTDWESIFEGIDLKHTLKVVSFMNTEGVFTDQTYPYVSRVAYDAALEIFSKTLIKNGYTGGDILSAAHYFPSEGYIYFIFDSEKYDYKSVIKYLEKIVNK